MNYLTAHTLVTHTACTHCDQGSLLAAAFIREDSSCSFGTNNYLTSCHNQIPSIKGTIQRLPAVIKLARVFLDFQLSPVGGALYPGAGSDSELCIAPGLTAATSQLQ